ncbi:HdeD family acid-resistance protein [Algibacter mikhailovii]|nr:DUF308 domain-containing protein [Algibacter mikhailovii]
MKKIRWIALIRGIVLIGLAFFVFRHPVNALIGVAIYIGISLLFIGITQTVLSILSKSTLENWGWVLAGGLIDILFGFMLLSNPALTAASLPFVVGFWIMVSGVMTFVNAFQNKKEGNANWWLGIIGGALSVVVGYLITNNILVGMFAITSWMGIGFAIAGILNIIIGFKLKSVIS